MSHTLHRLGTEANLANDYVVFAMSAKGFNEVGSAPKLKEFFRTALRYNPVNGGDMKTGNLLNLSADEVLANVQDISVVHAVFSSEEPVTALLRELREKDLGLSVVVSGLARQVDGCCKRAGLSRHTVEHSLGIWGRTGRLPSREVLEFTTMCGHHMVAASLVERAIRLVAHGRRKPEEMALELARPCVCGVFNPVRAKALLEEHAKAGAAAARRSQPHHR